MQCTRPYELVVYMKERETGKKAAHTRMVPCGSCIACRISRSRVWTLRILHELKYWEDASFVTFTYDPENLPSDLSLSKEEVQKLWKRLRKLYGKKKLKYFGCGEYGDENDRPHYHAIIFGVGFSEHVTEKIKGRKFGWKVLGGPLLEAWGKGFVTMSFVTPDSARYVTDYIKKALSGPMAKGVYGLRQPPFQVVSQGLGLRYAQENEKLIREKQELTLRGVPVSIPRYYRRKLGGEFQEVKNKAFDAKEESKELHRKRTGSYDPSVIRSSQAESRKQYEATLNAKAALRRKGNL